MLIQIVFISLIIISGFNTLLALSLCKRRFIYIFFKGLTTFLIAFFCFTALFHYTDSGTSSQTLFIILLFTGLLFSLAGDIVLSINNSFCFLSGLIFFAITHICYIFCFHSFSQFSLIDAGTGLVIIIVYIFLLKYFLPHLGKTRGPVIIYMSIIYFMVYRAIATLFSSRLSLLQGIFIASGAVLFFISDIFLGINTFIKERKRTHIINLLLYYSGQLLIALSCFYFPD